MIEELIDRKQVQEMFSLTTKQFGRVMKNILDDYWMKLYMYNLGYISCLIKIKMLKYIKNHV